MNNEMKKLIAAFGRLLIAISGEEEHVTAEEPVEAPVEKLPETPVEQPKRTYKEKTFTCTKCGSAFTGKCANAKYCPECRKAIKAENLKNFRAAFQGKNMAEPKQIHAKPEEPDMVYGNSIEL